MPPMFATGFKGANFTDKLNINTKRMLICYVNYMKNLCISL